MRTFLLYLLLVVIPVVGIILVLQSGKQLIPPQPVKGSWDFTLDAPGCSSIGYAGGGRLELQQSGVHLVARFGGSLVGRISGKLSGRELLFEADGLMCPKKTTEWRLQLVSPTRLEGVVRWPNCECSQVTFTAVRTENRKS